MADGIEDEPAAVDSARVEVKHLQVTGAMYGTGFLPSGDEPEQEPAKKQMRLAAGR